MLPPAWQTFTLFNPVLYLISGFHWSFYAIANVGVGLSMLMIVGFQVQCMAIIRWNFRTGYRVKQ